MSVSSTEHLDKLAFILYDRPAGRNVIGYAIEKIEQLRADNERLRADLATQNACCDGAAAQDAHVRQERAEHKAEIEKLRAEVRRQTRHVELLYDQIRRRADERDKAQIEVERLRAALRWYADPRNHFPVERRSPGAPDPAVIFVEEPPIMDDCGRRARAALEGEA